MNLTLIGSEYLPDRNKHCFLPIARLAQRSCRSNPKSRERSGSFEMLAVAHSATLFGSIENVNKKAGGCRSTRRREKGFACVGADV